MKTNAKAEVRGGVYWEFTLKGGNSVFACADCGWMVMPGEDVLVYGDPNDAAPRHSVCAENPELTHRRFTPTVIEGGGESTGQRAILGTVRTPPR